MKILKPILALLAAVCLGHSALGSDNNNGSLALAVTQDGHGGSHIMYYQTYSQETTSVALSTASGGLMNSTAMQGPPQADNGQVRFVTGTNQHGQANSAFIPLSSHFAQSNQ